MDVTEQVRLTQELQRREAYLAEAQRLSHTGSFGWKLDSGEIVWSAETYRIFGYDPTVRLTIDSIAQRASRGARRVPEQVIEVWRFWRARPISSMRIVCCCRTGRIKHVHALAHALTDARGNREFVGAGIDITEHKKAEEKITGAGNGAPSDAGPRASKRCRIWTRGDGGDGLYANRSALAHVGLSLEEWRQITRRFSSPRLVRSS